MGLIYVEGITHDFIGHATTSLLAALDVANGQVFTQCRAVKSSASVQSAAT
jgi:putative transposase